MRLAQKVILAIGFVTLGVLLWKMDAKEVLSLVAAVGWGFVLIIGQEAGAHIFNALGWRCAMRPEHAPSYGFGELFKFRIIGDGVNYLTPSATIAGEFARAAQLNDSQPFEVRLGGVTVAKFAQALGQMLLVLFGLAWVVRGMIPAMAPFETAIQFLAAAAAIALAGFVLWERYRPSRPDEEDRAASAAAAAKGLKGLPRQVHLFLRDHPGRFALAVAGFLMGYAWNTLEVYLIAHFLGVPLTWKMALAIEVLSNMVDGMLFMVPAKVGTQEAGKTAIFALLGLPPQSGFAFGIVRHIRELSWGSFGLLLYSHHVRGRKKAEASGPVDSGKEEEKARKESEDILRAGPTRSPS